MRTTAKTGDMDRFFPYRTEEKFHFKKSCHPKNIFIRSAENSFIQTISASASPASRGNKMKESIPEGSSAESEICEYRTRCFRPV